MCMCVCVCVCVCTGQILTIWSRGVVTWSHVAIVHTSHSPISPSISLPFTLQKRERGVKIKRGGNWIGMGQGGSLDQGIRKKDLGSLGGGRGGYNTQRTERFTHRYTDIHTHTHIHTSTLKGYRDWTMDLKFMISVIYFGDVLLQLLLFKLILGYLGYTVTLQISPLFSSTPLKR